MSPKWSLALAVIFIGLESIHSAAKKDWTYVIDSFRWNCTDESAFATNLRVIRGDGGVYVVNGTVTINAVLDDKYQIETKMLRSSKGNNQYTLTPYRIPKTDLYSFLNGLYKKYLKDDLTHCSDFITFEGEWQEPLQPHEYHLSKCLFGIDTWPPHLQPGYYQMLILFEGPLFKYVGELIVKVDSKISVG